MDRPTLTGLSVMVGVLGVLALGPAALHAQGHAEPVPEYLPDVPGTSDSHDGTPPAALPAPALMPDGPDTSYRGMLAAGYLLAIPAAGMTGGVGILLPVGMHYHHHNPTGGVRALFGIVGGIAAGGTVGGLIDQPDDGFRFTPGMLAGMASGFFLWGVIDVAFFGTGGRARMDTLARPAPGSGRLALGVDVLPRGQGALATVRGKL